MKKRILLMYSPNSSGHQRAALAIEAAIREVSSEAEVLTIDFFNYSSPIMERIIIRLYLGLIKAVPAVWGYLYDNRRLLNKISWVRVISYRVSANKAKRILKDFQPEAIVCTQAFPCGVMADYKKRFGSNFLLIGVLTDYLPHSYWIFEEVDRYVVSSIWARQYLIKFGITEDRISSYGIPVHPKFRYLSDRRQALINRLNFNPALPVVLIMGGSYGAGPIEKTVYELDKINLDFQMIVITGINVSLRKKLDKKRQYFEKPLKILGYVDNINEIMEISTLIITKPGGITCAEALVKELPIVMLNPIPGQETNNARFLLEQGVALSAGNEQEVTGIVFRLLREPNELDRMRRNSRQISSSDAAVRTAKLALGA